MKTNRRIPSIKLNDQAAMDYALYMMMSSFFKKVESLSPIFEEQLLLRYRTQSAKSQEVMENMCVGAVDHYLPLVLPEYIQNFQVQVSFRRGNADGVTTFIFDGGIFTLELFAKINGARRTLIGYVFQEEGADPVSGKITIRYRAPLKDRSRVSLEFDEIA